MDKGFVGWVGGNSTDHRTRGTPPIARGLWASLLRRRWRLGHVWCGFDRAYRRAASHVGRIRKGEKPTDAPPGRGTFGFWKLLNVPSLETHHFFILGVVGPACR